jgi:hypothetical protein
VWTLPKERLAGKAVTDELVPVPDTATGCGLLLALSVNFNVAVRVPAPDGLKIMFAVQVAEADSVEQLVFE